MTLRRTRRILRRRGAAAALALALLACAPPPEADHPISERVRDAPPPRLRPTAEFEAPLRQGVAAAERIGPERDALAARAEALRARAAALSQAEVVDAEGRGRLDAARPE